VFGSGLNVTMRFQGLGCGVKGPGFRVQGSDLDCRESGADLRGKLLLVLGLVDLEEVLRAALLWDVPAGGFGVMLWGFGGLR